LGTHAEFVPRGRFTIRSFGAEEFPSSFAMAMLRWSHFLAKRTFGDKATILHAEYHRPPERPLPGRYSRRYYDVAILTTCESSVLSASASSRIAHCAPGSLRLLPAKKRLTELERDYRNMGVMIFGEPPALEKVVTTLTALEEEINT
jgi:hypothetical protein